MDPQLRFEILSTIGTGDFATVYRARDRELGREVAIKQIHQQFLQDPRQLERYWQEAQLLAKLEHPHIMTIYDIVRDRGWLVLELMQGSLSQMLAGRPIDLHDLRMAIIYTAHALQFMQQHGMYHGDVKPGNLLVDKNSRVKLGDFGIARRIVGEHGSVVKGTTRYMAPEVVSDQFGPVGPHSDLYSLGFSAYELMCGENFESLFPGLNMFGRDKQMAWMMWHSALDRRLPEIKRVLEGVPDDLAYVIQRLCEKDPAKRYKSADQVIADLKGAAMTVEQTEEQEAAAAVVAKQARRKRQLTIAAFVASVTISVSMLFMGGETKPVKTDPPPPKAGTIGEMDVEHSRFYLRAVGASAPASVTVNPALDRIFVNGDKAAFELLQPDDVVEIKDVTVDGEKLKEIYATRPLEAEVAATLVSVAPRASTLTVSAADGLGGEMEVYVPSAVKITINGQTQANRRPVQIVDLLPQDRLSIRHVTDDRGRLVARSIQAVRMISDAGVVASRNPPQRKLTLQLAGKATEFTVAADCPITLNGKDRKGENPVTLADLIAGDRVSVSHDTQIRRIEAQRDTQAAGGIVAMNASQRSFTVAASGDAPSRTFLLASTCQILSGEKRQAVDFFYMRPGDEVTVDFDAIDQDTLQATAVMLTPASDPRTWAIIVGQQNFDDGRLSPLLFPVNDAARLRDVLVERYRVPSDQILFEQDVSRLKLEQGLAAFLPRVTPGSQLLCYFVGHAFVDAQKSVVLAPKEFDSGRAAEFGVKLKWLVEQLDKSSAQEKLLLLDTCHDGKGDDLKAQPSSAEQAESLKESAKRPVSATVTVIASCDKGQRGVALENSTRGQFGSLLAAAFQGLADANRDYRVDGNELFSYLTGEMSKSSASSGRAQKPVRFLPDTKPPRLSQEAREAVRRMVGQFKAKRLDEGLAGDYSQAALLAPKQPDLALAFGLVLLKNGRPTQSLPVFEKIALEHPETPVVYQALAWQHFVQAKFPEGLADLKQLVTLLPEPGVDPARDPYIRDAFQFAGALRMFALQAAEPRSTLADVQALDRAVVQRGETAKQRFAAGIKSVAEVLKEIDGAIIEAPSREKKLLLETERKNLPRYASIPFDSAAEFIKAGLTD